MSISGRLALRHTADEADRLGSEAIDTEHLLLGLLRDTKSSVPRLLSEAGIELDASRNIIAVASGAAPVHPRRSQKQTLKPLSALILLVALILVIAVIVKIAVG